MFEPITRALARFSTRHPWIAIAIVFLIVGFAGSRGMPSMANDSASFAPSNPAIAAADRIDELFGADSAVSPLQVALVAGSGDMAIRMIDEAAHLGLGCQREGGLSVEREVARKGGFGDVCGKLGEAVLAAVAGQAG